MSCLDLNLRSICVKIVATKCQLIKIPKNQKDLHVSDALIKRNGFEFQKQSIRIENVRISRIKGRYNRFSINQKNARRNSVIKIGSSNQHLSNRKVIRGTKMSSSMTLSNPTFNESVLPTVIK